ncbi:unnamed protein product [Polarella glacialis]|nr:unnamed protein product [Polarella glacialis]
MEPDWVKICDDSEDRSPGSRAATDAVRRAADPLRPVAADLEIRGTGLRLPKARTRSQPSASSPRRKLLAEEESGGQSPGHHRPLDPQRPAGQPRPGRPAREKAGAPPKSDSQSGSVSPGRKQLGAEEKGAADLCGEPLRQEGSGEAEAEHEKCEPEDARRHEDGADYAEDFQEQLAEGKKEQKEGQSLDQKEEIRIACDEEPAGCKLELSQKIEDGRQEASEDEFEDDFEEELGEHEGPDVKPEDESEPTLERLKPQEDKEEGLETDGASKDKLPDDNPTRKGPDSASDGWEDDNDGTVNDTSSHFPEAPSNGHDKLQDSDDDDDPFEASGHDPFPSAGQGQQAVLGDELNAEHFEVDSPFEEDSPRKGKESKSAVADGYEEDFEPDSP